MTETNTVIANENLNTNKETTVTETAVIETPKAKPAKKAKAVDIRGGLPVAVKSGTAHKPVWHIDGVQFKFIEPLTKFGLTPEGRKPNLGKRTVAKYKAGTTRAGADLMFVGVFAVVKVKEAAADEIPASVTVSEPPAEAKTTDENGLLPPTAETVVAEALASV